MEKELTSANKIEVIISVCTLKDIKTWIRTSHSLLKYIDSNHYVVIVPHNQVGFFLSVTPPSIEVIDESILTNDFSKKYIEDKMGDIYKLRAGWYYQQLLKIKALEKFTTYDDAILLIWDADTIALNSLNFIQSNKIAYCTGDEHHYPYFETISKLLGYSKVVKNSFIAQNFPTKGKWIKEFINFIEQKFGLKWYEAILETTDLKQSSGFSEYETLGNFVTTNYPEEIIFQKCDWDRNGKKLGSITNLEQIKINNNKLQYISYEGWMTDNKDKNYKLIIKKPSSEEDFLRKFFDYKAVKTVIQVGANDGVMCDPLREYLVQSKYNDVSVILIEPLNFYFDKLSLLHSERPNTTLLNIAICEVKSVKNFYYIDPIIANEMNGNGPQNNWAHGQGSFHRDSVEFWIHQNSFRGSDYVANIDKYMGSIIQKDVDCIPLKQISYNINDLTVLVIDAQGAEEEILKSVDWMNPPDALIFEQDKNKDLHVYEFLRQMSYEYVAGNENMLFINTDTIAFIS